MIKLVCDVCGEECALSQTIEVASKTLQVQPGTKGPAPVQGRQFGADCCSEECLIEALDGLKEFVSNQWQLKKKSSKLRAKPTV